MIVNNTKLNGCVILQPTKFSDDRGWFMESYNMKKLAEIGITGNFVQDNHSFSAQKGTLRGIHFQNHPYSQAKLVRCTEGRILDVAVDLRDWSSTYLQWIGIELSQENNLQLYIPEGFGHGFLTLTDNVQVQYKTNSHYDAQSDRSIRFDDGEIGIDWGIKNPILSDKDAFAPLLKEVDLRFKGEN